MHLKPLYTLFFLLVSAALFGQTIPFKNFNSENHLPSNEVYQIHEDKEGFIWICTDRGVLRFDGQNFKHFTSLDGLVSNSVFDACSDHQGRTWFVTLKNELCYHYQHKIYKHPLSDQLKEALGSYATLPYLTTDRNGGVFISYQHRHIEVHNDYYYIPPNGKELITKTPDLSFIKDSIKTKQLFILKEGLQHLMIGLQHHIGINGSSVENKKGSFPFVYQRKGNLIYAGMHGNYDLLRLINKRFLFFNKKELISLDPQTEKTITCKIPDENNDRKIIKVHEDAQQNLWLATTKGILYYPKGDLKQLPKILFLDYYITSILISSNGNLWFSTYENGAFWVPNQKIFTFLKSTTSEKKKFITLFQYKNKNYGCTQRGLIYQLLPNGPIFKTKIKTNYISDVLFVKDSLLLCSNGSILQFPDLKKQSFHQTVGLSSGHIKSIYQTPSQEIWFATSTGLYSFNNYQTKSTSLTIRSNSIESHKNERELLVGSNEGLFLYDTEMDTFSALGIHNSILKERITAITKTHKSFYLLGTIGAGLIVLDSNLIVKQQLDLKDGLISAFIKNIYLENDSIVWLTSNNGCNRIHFSSNFSIKNIHSFTSKTILPSSSVNDILVDSNWVWIATNNGLAYVDKTSNLYQQAAPPKVYISSAKVNGSPLIPETILRDIHEYIKRLIYSKIRVYL